MAGHGGQRGIHQAGIGRLGIGLGAGEGVVAAEADQGVQAAGQAEGQSGGA